MIRPHLCVYCGARASAEVVFTPNGRGYRCLDRSACDQRRDLQQRVVNCGRCGHAARAAALDRDEERDGSGWKIGDWRCKDRVACAQRQRRARLVSKLRGALAEDSIDDLYH